jgi:uncharacterized protein
MNAVSHRVSAKRQYLVDLRDHHAQCELNFHRFLTLLPGCRDGELFWSFYVGANRQHRVTVQLLESAPYTTTLEIQQEQTGGAFFSGARWRIRLYHDVEMAEVVAWDRQQHWQGRYDYPNKHMYQPDEKLALNRFLGDWLEHCRKQGICPDNIVIKFTNI